MTSGGNVYRAFKRSIHHVFRAFGFDVRSVHHLDDALEQRERERRDAYHRHLAELKSLRARTPPVARDPAREAEGDAVLWVGASELLATAAARLREARVVLDIGCAFRPQELVDAEIHICCEPFPDYLHRLMVETEGDRRFVYLQATMQEAVRLIPAGSVDTVFLLDVIEHVDRETGLACLGQFLRMARSQVVVFTPIGFMPQEAEGEHGDQWGMSGGAWQEHRSGWEPSDFSSREGWQVVACREFHTRDAHGRDLPQPIGAMWAIWTVKAK